MRDLGIRLLGAFALAACASNGASPPASSSTVAQATNEPNRGPDFAPASSDGLATAPAEPPSTRAATAAPIVDAPRAEPTTQEFATGERGPVVDTTSGNAAATPADRTSAPNADNARVHERDRSSSALTPMDQGSSASDRAITQQIRKDLMKDKSLSFTAKNVKVITVDGKVTLRGTVKSEAERAAIEAAARRATGDGARVDNQLEVSK